MQGGLGSRVVGLGKLEGGLDGRHSSAALVVLEVVGGGYNGGEVKCLGNASVVSVGFAAFEHKQLVVVQSHGFVFQLVGTLGSQLQSKRLGDDLNPEVVVSVLDVLVVFSLGVGLEAFIGGSVFSFEFGQFFGSHVDHLAESFFVLGKETGGALG